MDFEVLGKIQWAETIATGRGIRELRSGKFLRVILLSDGETVHNAFFDRSFKGETK